MQQDIDDNNEENIVANMSAIDTALACRKQTNNIDELLALALFYPLVYALSKHQTTSIANHRYVVPRTEFR